MGTTRKSEIENKKQAAAAAWYLNIFRDAFRVIFRVILVCHKRVRCHFNDIFVTCMTHVFSSIYKESRIYGKNRLPVLSGFSPSLPL